MNTVRNSIIESQISLRSSNDGIETAEAVIKRVAKALSLIERKYGTGNQAIQSYELQFINAMKKNKLWPSGRILNNAGSIQGQLGSCFVIPVQDDFASIYDTMSVAAECHRTGGGTGFDFSNMRESGANISSSQSLGASGPMPWIELLNASTKTVMSGGKTRGANLATLSVYHPNILEFIRSKDVVGKLPYFNLSVLIDDKFMRRLSNGEDIDLVSPSSGKIIKQIPASEIWEAIAKGAWNTGDPGILFLDNINKNNPLINHLGPIRATNPCGEHGLYPFEASNLASINLAAFIDKTGDDLDWDELKDIIILGVRLLDNAIDASTYPEERIAKIAKANRRIGLGIMGLADLLIKLEIRYDSEEALKFCERIAAFIQKHAWRASANLAKERGVFPNYQYSNFKKEFRNCAVTSIAPTGTISLIAGCSSGIEPRFGPSYRKNILDDSGVTFMDPDLLNSLISNGLSKNIATKLIYNVNARRSQFPASVNHVFRYAHDISPSWHVKMLSVWQKYTDNGVSKTINVHKAGTYNQIADAFLLSWQLGCKGVSAYREGSREVDLQELIFEPVAPIIQSKLLSAGDNQ